MALQAYTVKLKGKVSITVALGPVDGAVFQPISKLQLLVVTAWAIFVIFAVIVSGATPTATLELAVQGRVQAAFHQSRLRQAAGLIETVYAETSEPIPVAQFPNKGSAVQYPLMYQAPVAGLVTIGSR